MIQYRTFRNDDPPALVTIWNESFTGRGAVRMRTASPLEYFVFAKPYFDPAGLLVAADDGALVGFAHAGFGANEGQTGLARERGVTCLLAVRPDYRGRGVGSELLRRSEVYLLERGAKELHAGCTRPLNPFYFGLYGGSDAPGLLDSDRAAQPFLERKGYLAGAPTLVLQRGLCEPFEVVDGRFAALRRRFEVRAALASGTGSWWQECVLGPLEVLEFRLEDRATGEPAARAGVWEMQGFSQCWNEPAVGVVGVEVRPDLRRQGLAKFLLNALLRQAQDQYFSLAEVQVAADDPATLGLCRSLGFKQVDVGRSYRKQPPPVADAPPA